MGMRGSVVVGLSGLEAKGYRVGERIEAERGPGRTVYRAWQESLDREVRIIVGNRNAPRAADGVVLERGEHEGRTFLVTLPISRLPQITPAPRTLPMPPSLFDLRLDLLLTVLAVSGMLLFVTGLTLLITQRGVDIFGISLGSDFAGILVAIYGLLLWNAAERARRYWPGARTLLLALTLVATPTLFAIPFALWTWVVLLGRRMRIYLDARLRGLEGPAAAALAHGHRLASVDHLPSQRRLRAAARANRRVAALFGVLGLGAAVAGLLIGLRDPADLLRLPGTGFVIAMLAAWCIAFCFALLSARVEEGRSLRGNAGVWTVLGPVAPTASRRARMLVRDRRDALI